MSDDGSIPLRGFRWEALVNGAHDGNRHVLPIDDLREHVENRDCWCKPVLSRTDDNRILVTHNALDGRELVERHGVQ
jgi:hypothetical protein